MAESSRSREFPVLLSPLSSRFAASGHSRNPSRSPTRQRIITDDLLSDLSPTSTLEAFTSGSGALKASIEAASATERAFGVRAAIASKSIHEWVTELSAWPWPQGGSKGFEIPPAKRRKRSADEHRRPIRDGTEVEGDQGSSDEQEYWGSLLARDVELHEIRIDEIVEDMEALDVEDIKAQVLSTHAAPKSRPSSSHHTGRFTPSSLSYTKMDDFTAVITATVLRALPNLSRLMTLMNVWTVRLALLRQVKPLLVALVDAEIALKSGWSAVGGRRHSVTAGLESEDESSPLKNITSLSQESFEIMRDVLQGKVTQLGQQLDHMLDALEGQNDTLPEAWLDRMEAIEEEYGEWAVFGDRKVRESEWAREVALRKQVQASQVASSLRDSGPATPSSPEKPRSPTEQSLAASESGNGDNPHHGDVNRDVAALTESITAIPSSFSDLALLDGAHESCECKATPLIDWPVSKNSHMPELVPTRNSVSVSNDNGTHVAATAQGLLGPVSNDKGETLNDTGSVSLVEPSDVQAPLDYHSNPPMTASPKHMFETPANPASVVSLSKEVDSEVDSEESATSPILTSEDEPLDEAVERHTGGNSSTPRNSSPSSESRISTPKIPTRENELLEKAVERYTEGNSSTPRNSSPSSESSISTPPILASIDEPLNQAVERRIEGNSFIPRSSPSSESRISIPKIPISAEEPLEQAVERRTEGNSLTPRKASPSSESRTSTPKIPTSEDEPLEKAVERHTEGNSSTPRNSSPSSESSISFALKSPSNQPNAGVFLEDGGTPRSPTKASRHGQRSAARPRQPSPPFVTQVQDTADPFRSVTASTPPETWSITPKNSNRHAIEGPRTPPAEDSLSGHSSSHVPSKSRDSSPQRQDAVSSNLKAAKGIASSKKHHPILVLGEPLLSFAEIPMARSNRTSETAYNDGARTKRDSYGSGISEYASSESTPEIYEAEPAEYFRPALSPVKSVRGSPHVSRFTTPAGTSHKIYPIQSPIVGSPIRPLSPVLTQTSADETSEPEKVTADFETPHQSSPGAFGRTSSQSDLFSEAQPPIDVHALENTTPGGLRGSSILQISTVQEHEKPIETAVMGRTTPPTPESQSSRVNRHDIAADESTLPSIETPSRSLIVEDTSVLDSPDFEDESPSISRTRVRDEMASYSPMSSTFPVRAISQHRSLQSLKNLDNDVSSLSPNTSSSPSILQEAPVLPNVEVTAASSPLSPKKASDSQLQQQISEILESIPARITLTSEPVSGPKSSPVIVKKRSVSGPFGSRAPSRASTPTPSFTLAPAYARTPRPRPQNGNPEIKLYHLSRSTGEAPIKLFVRLVGESGERVMVRVGGGWADLGAYLKEYALHHGRRSDKDGKVEIQDVATRVVSSGSAMAHSGLRSGAVTRNGRSSPISRPGSSFDRPMSSLAVRKTRDSVGDKACTQSPGSPHTPGLAQLSRHTLGARASTDDFSTPDSAQSHASSQLNSSADRRPSETELGLAGPRRRQTEMSEESMAWVESMKEKVRVASAEKEREKNREFGGLGRVGGTKRLFKKSA
ncbi:MAG: hypothetical protein M1818_000083 [Claussenomyces sp. TS43310]|nr:MAG: hypothetical protein M1818_000083 [Claussenomyces sp. TS43310]